MGTCVSVTTGKSMSQCCLKESVFHLMLHQMLAKIVKQSVAYNFGCRTLYNLPCWASVSIHQVKCNIPSLRPYCEKIYTTFLNNAEILTTHGYVLWCSHIVYISPYSLNTTTTFDFMIECSDVAAFVWGRVQATILPHFTWLWPGLYSVSYSGCSVMQSVMG